MGSKNQESSHATERLFGNESDDVQEGCSSSVLAGNCEPANYREGEGGRNYGISVPGVIDSRVCVGLRGICRM
jgi:hypothetical protein